MYFRNRSSAELCFFSINIRKTLQVSHTECFIRVPLSCVFLQFLISHIQNLQNFVILFQSGHILENVIEN